VDLEEVEEALVVVEEDEAEDEGGTNRTSSAHSSECDPECPLNVKFAFEPGFLGIAAGLTSAPVTCNQNMYSVAEVAQRLGLVFIITACRISGDERSAFCYRLSSLMAANSSLSGLFPSTNSDNEDSSMITVLLEPLKTMNEISQSLFLSLGPAQSKPPPFPPLHRFIECDDALSAAVRLAHTHQTKQRKIETLEAEILDLDARWRQICVELERGKRELQAVIREGDERIRSMEKAKEAAIPYPELLTYAQSLSAFTSAPPNMPDMSLPGQPPPPLFFPPFPNEEKMRRGRLNAEAPLGMAGETHSVGRRRPAFFRMV
jgi:mediator of RNA polymerase II transcription subunit 4